MASDMDTPVVLLGSADDTMQPISRGADSYTEYLFSGKLLHGVYGSMGVVDKFNVFEQNLYTRNWPVVIQLFILHKSGYNYLSFISQFIT